MKLKLLLIFMTATIISLIFLIKASTPLSDITAKRGGDFTPPRPALTSAAPARKIASTKFSVTSEIDEIQSIESCLQNHCSYDDSDPRSYELSVYKDLGEKLKSFYERVVASGLQDESIAKMARYYLSFGDGHVKEAALELMSTQTPSQSNLSALKKYVFDFHDPLIVAQGMGELRKYVKKYDDEVNQIISGVLATGSISAREEVAKGLFPFINKDNYQKIVSLRSKYKKGSRVYRLISQALIQFDNR